MATQLRTICNLDDALDIEREHRHLCEECNTCWKHENTIKKSKKEWKEAHTCPNCGEFNNSKHRTAEEDAEIERMFCELAEKVGPFGALKEMIAKLG